MSIPFDPILKDLPISYALENREYFVNKARSNAWGGDVLFFPSTLAYDKFGCAIAGYFYGAPYVNDTNPLWNKTDPNGNKPHYLNCTGVQGAFYHKRTGIILTCLLGSAFGTYERYDGRKDGGNFDNEYIGDTIQNGDMLIFADIGKDGKPNIKGDGHIVSVEDNNTMVIMEGAYSRNEVYRDKICITYKLNKGDMFTGKTITLRPQSPYKEILYGVIHTGDFFNEWQIPQAVKKDINKNQLYVGDIELNIRKDHNTNSTILGMFNKPKAYYNVLSISKETDYAWYLLENDCWVAGVKGTKYYQNEELDYKALYEKSQKKLSSVKNYANKILEVIDQ